MSEEDISTRQSLSLVDMTSQTTTSNTGDSEKLVADLKKQVLALQSENSGLKRALPKMKEIGGVDLTEKMKQLCDNLAKAEETSEQWENKYAESEQNFSRFQRKTNDELDARDNYIQQLKAKAKHLEEDNEKLKKQAENDQSKIFHLQNDADVNDPQNLSMGEFERSFDSDNISRIKQDLADKAEENARMMEKLELAKKTVADLKHVLEQQSRAIKHVASRDVEDDSIFALPAASVANPSFSDADYIIAQVLSLLQQLDNNDRDTNKLREEMIKFMREHGYDVDQRNVAEISKELEFTFRTKFNSRRNQIKRANEELANEFRFDNTELGRQLNQLSDDSIYSSVAPFAQPTGDTHTSFAVDLGASTVGMDILNKTADVAHDLGEVVGRMNSLRGICGQLFEKLRGTAEFLQSLLDNLEDSEEGRELLQKINDIKLDLDKSMGEARYLVEQVKRAEKNVSEFRGLLEQTLDQTAGNQSKLQQEFSLQGDVTGTEEVKQEIERLKAIEGQYEALKISLNNELSLKESLNRNIADLQRKMDDKEQELQEEIYSMQDRLDEQTENAEKLQKIIDEKSQALEDLQTDSNEKDRVIAESEQECHRLQKLLQNSKESIEETRLQLTELIQKYQAMMEAWKEQQAQINDQAMDIHKLEAEVDTLEKEKQDLKENQGTAALHLEDKLVSLSQINSEIERDNETLRTQMRELDAKINRQDELVAKSNAVLFEKLSKGLQDENESLDNTLIEESSENISGFEEFTKFLEDCNDRSNKLVQLLKKSESASSDLGYQVPYMQHLLNETRAIRLMLYSITKFFASQKENLKKDNKLLGREIRLELKKIYDTLNSAAHSVHLSAGSQKKKET